MSKKLSFSLLCLALILFSLILVSAMKFSEWTTLYLVVSSHISILIIAVTYLTGQAKIDLEAMVSIGGKSPERKI